MVKDNTMRFYVSAGEGGTLSVLGLWGTYSGEVTLQAEDTITGRSGVHHPPANNEPAAPAEPSADTTEAEGTSTTADTEKDETGTEGTSASTEETTQTPTDTTAASEETTGAGEETTQAETAGETTSNQ